MIATSIRNNSITIVVNNKVYTKLASDPNYEKILDAIRNNDESTLIELLDIRPKVARFTEGRMAIVGNEVTYNGRPIHNIVVDRLLGFMNANLPVQPLLRFMDKLMENPSKRAVDELYTFLENKNLPITPDGNFLAYKGLNNNSYSIFGNTSTVVLEGVVDAEGHILNSVGATIEVARNSVCDNKELGCSPGLHAGSVEYATGYAQGKMVIVEINPKDVVSVPLDCACQKLRTCKYKVIAEYVQPLNDTYSSEFTEDDDLMDGFIDDESVDDPDGDLSDEELVAYEDGREAGEYDRTWDLMYGQGIEYVESDPLYTMYHNGYYDGYYGIDNKIS